MKRLIIMLIAISIVLVGCSSVNTDTSKETVINAEETKENTVEKSNDKYRTFQYSRSMDWDFIDEEFLLKIAQYKGGTVEDRAYTILVTLNRVWNTAFIKRYSEYTRSSIQDVVLRELYEVEGLTPYNFEEIIPDETTIQAMIMVKYEKFDNSNGSLEYK